MESGRAAEIVEQATTMVFGTMLGTELRAEPFFEDPTPFHESAVTALIGFAGAMSGYVALHCPSCEQARDFTARLLGVDSAEIESLDDVSDAVGEVVNMIAGKVKTALAGSEGPVEIALPTVIMTPKSDVRVKADTCVVVPFEDDRGEQFHVELVIERRSR